jgi:hypothetical protein
VVEALCICKLSGVICLSGSLRLEPAAGLFAAQLLSLLQWVTRLLLLAGMQFVPELLLLFARTADAPCLRFTPRLSQSQAQLRPGCA